MGNKLDFLLFVIFHIMKKILRSGQQVTIFAYENRHFFLRKTHKQHIFNQAPYQYEVVLSCLH